MSTKPTKDWGYILVISAIVIVWCAVTIAAQYL